MGPGPPSQPSHGYDGDHDQVLGQLTMAFQGIDMLCDSKWGQYHGGLRVSRETHSVNVEPVPDQPAHGNQLAVALTQPILEGVEAATRPQLFPESSRQSLTSK
jgi:hypothetical protein